MSRPFHLVLVLVALPTTSRADEFDGAHPDERPTLVALLQVHGITKLDEHGRATGLNVPFGGSLSNEHMPLVASLTELRELDLSNARVSDEGLIQLKKLSKLRRLHLPGSLSKAFEHSDSNWAAALQALQGLQRDDDVSEQLRVSDEGVSHLAELTQLEELGLESTWTGDDGLKSLAKLTHLRKLNLAYTDVTDAGMQHLRHFQRLTALRLDDTGVSDAGLKQLAALTKLQSLSLRGTLASRQGVEDLRTRIPRLKVTPDVLPVRQQVAAVRALRYAGGEVELDEHGRAIRVVTVNNKDGLDLGLFIRLVAGLAEIKNERERDIAVAALAREISLSQLQPLPALTTLRELDLTGLVVKDEDLVLMSNLTMLRTLDLSGTEISDEGLRHLARLTQIEDLDLSGTGISNAGLRHLARLTQIERLKLTGTNTTVDGFIQVSVEMHKRTVPEALKILGLVELKDDGTIEEWSNYQRHVTDLTVKYLKPLTSLTELDLSDGNITDAGLVHVAEMTHVRGLNLTGKPVSDKGVAHLHGLSELRRLDLERTQVTDRGLTNLPSTGLEELNLKYTAVTDAGIAHLANLTSLKTLYLRGTRISHQAAEKLRAERPDLIVYPRQLPNANIVNDVMAVTREGVYLTYDSAGELVEVIFSQVATTDDDLQDLAAIKTLKRLYLNGDQISEAGAASLAGLSNLEEFGVEGVPFSSPMLKHLEKMTKLEWLNLIGTKTSDRGLAHLKSLTNLKWLGLSRTGVTDAGLAHLDKLRNLDGLDLIDTSVSDEGIHRLQRSLPDCKIVR